MQRTRNHVHARKGVGGERAAAERGGPAAPHLRRPGHDLRQKNKTKQMELRGFFEDEKGGRWRVAAAPQNPPVRNEKAHVGSPNAPQPGTLKQLRKSGGSGERGGRTRRARPQQREQVWQGPSPTRRPGRRGCSWRSPTRRSWGPRRGRRACRRRRRPACWTRRTSSARRRCSARCRSP